MPFSTDPHRSGGRGLHIVDAASSRWGVRKGTAQVWFELERQARAPAASRPWLITPQPRIAGVGIASRPMEFRGRYGRCWIGATDRQPMNRILGVIGVGRGAADLRATRRRWVSSHRGRPAAGARVRRACSGRCLGKRDARDRGCGRRPEHGPSGVGGATGCDGRRDPDGTTGRDGDRCDQRFTGSWSRARLACERARDRVPA
jgi:hypothetical protein